MELLLQHLQLAILIGAIGSGITEFIKDKLSSAEKEMSAMGKLILSLVVTIVFSFGFCLYYNAMTPSDTVAVTLLSIFGAQSIYALIEKLTINVEVETEEEE